MFHWKQVRIWLLAVIFVCVFGILSKSIFYPGGNQQVFKPYDFPATVPLPEWQIVESAPIAKKTDDPNLWAGQHYRYLQNQLPLDIEMRYLIRTDGKIESLIPKYTGVQFSAGKLALHPHPELGYYAVWVHQERAYLSACINSRGGSTVTADQFSENRNTYDVEFSRFIPWLLGFQELRDLRCLLTTLSIPVEKASPDHADKILEKAWFSWYRWWQPRFPPA